MGTSLQAIFRKGFDRYQEQHGVSLDQHRAAQAIMTCQCEERGHETWICQTDGYEEKVYHSCRHRSCPRCQGGLTHDWLEKLQARLLPCDHYHVVVTLPHELNAIWRYNKDWCSDRLLKAGAETLRQLLADERYLGAEVGIVAALHTWGRTLSFHPHVHLLVTGGGIGANGEWVAAKRDFLLPVGVLKAKFRGKWLSWLNEAYGEGQIALPEGWSEQHWKKALSKSARKPWNVRIQGAYRHGTGVATYLSRYVRGGPIKESRLLESGEERVGFRYQDHRDGKRKVMCLRQADFIGRVLTHVPVKGRHQVRYYGLYVPGAQGKREQARQALGDGPAPRVEAEKPQRCCPRCGEPLSHYASTRGKFSSIRNHAPRSGVRDGVQQDVEVDRAGISEWKGYATSRPPPDFLGRAAAT